MLYMVTFSINIPPMLAYIPYMDPMGNGILMIRISRDNWNLSKKSADDSQTHMLGFE